MVFTFIPVLVNLLVNVNNISFLQRKFPVNNTSTPSEYHWRSDVLTVQQLIGTKICISPVDISHSNQSESYMLRIIILFTLQCARTLLFFWIVSEKQTYEGPTDHTTSQQDWGQTQATDATGWFLCWIWKD